VSGTNAAVAYRGFTNSLSSNTVFRIKWHNEGIGFSTNQMGGFSLRQGNTNATTDDYEAGAVFSLFYQGGTGYDSFHVRDGSGVYPLGVTFGSNPFQIEFIRLGTNTYRLLLKDVTGANTLFSQDSLLVSTGSIDSVALFARQTDSDQVFNQMQISTTSLIPPEIINVSPVNGTIFHVFSNRLEFDVTSAFSTIPTNTVSVVVNGIQQTNLTFGSNPTFRHVVVNSNLPDNTVVTAMITAADANGNVAARTVTFNTWRATNPFIEAEDYNFSAGGWIDNLTNAQPNQLYAGRLGTNEIDFLETEPTNAYNFYRFGDLPQVEYCNDLDHGRFAQSNLYDFNLAFNQFGEWTDYTRRLSNTTYDVYARMAGFGADPVMLLDHLASPTVNSSNQARAALGTFVCPSDTGGPQTYAFVPLKDFFSNPVRIRLPGTNTLRCTPIGTSGSYNFTYLALVPSSNTSTVRPYLSAGYPFPGAQLGAPDPLLEFTIANAETAVVPASIQLFVNGSNVTSGLSLSNNAAGTVVRYQSSSLVPLNSTNTLVTIFSDGVILQTNQWQFTVTDTPKILSSSALFGSTDGISGTVPVSFGATVHPGHLDTIVAFEYGLTSSYGGVSQLQFIPAGAAAAIVGTTINGFIPGFVYHYRVVATNQSGVTLGPDNVISGGAYVPGDVNHDNIVDQAELDAVLAYYWPTSPWLYMTNVAGLGGTNVSFALTNSTAGAFSVEYSTNLADWYFLGPAIPRYLFIDSNAPAIPQRYYRLVWP
jgi:hypothetical protein